MAAKQPCSPVQTRQKIRHPQPMKTPTASCVADPQVGTGRNKGIEFCEIDGKCGENVGKMMDIERE